MKADTICCYEAHGKKGIAESLHVQITRARLTVCEVGIFSRELSQLLKIHPPPSYLSSSPIGVFSRDYHSPVLAEYTPMYMVWLTSGISQR